MSGGTACKLYSITLSTAVPRRSFDTHLNSWQAVQNRLQVGGMWRKFNKKDTAIGSPTLIETTFDQQYLDTIPEVDSLRSGRSSGNPPALPQLPLSVSDQQVLQDMLTYHSKAVEPLAPPNCPVTEHRASSIYSQPGSGTLRVHSHISDRVLSVCSEVSPLTSPRASTDLDLDETPDVSPIEPRPSPSLDFRELGPVAHGQPPLPRKVSPAAEPASSLPRRSPHCRRASAEAIENKQAASPIEPTEWEQSQRPKEKSRKLLSGFQERPPTGSGGMMRPPRRDSLDHPVYREPWKGASGRTALVDPVRNVPRSRQDAGPVSKSNMVGKDFNAHAVVTLASARSTTSAAQSSHALPRQPTHAPDSPIKPVAPLKIRNNATRTRSPTTVENLSGPSTRHCSVATIPSSERALSHTADGSRADAQVTPSTSTQEEANKASSEPFDPLRPLTADKNLRSRFSWTTYATTTTAPPPKTPENEPLSRFSWTTYATSVQESPHLLAQRETNTASIPPISYLPKARAVRQRLVRSYSDDPNPGAKANMDLKPTALPSHYLSQNSSSVTAAEADSSASPTDTLPADRSKSLPQCPPELEARDRIGALEARMDDLARRRHNIGLILKELNNVVQPTSFASDLTAREEAKKIVNSLEDEKRAIEWEEHETGMTLHRLRRKRDQSIDGNWTEFWVKTVTS